MQHLPLSKKELEQRIAENPQGAQAMAMRIRELENSSACPGCEGRGVLKQEYGDGPNHLVSVTCNRCNGTGTNP